MYHTKAKPSVIIFDGKPVSFDSQTEARMAMWLEQHGFQNRWRRIATGAANGGSHYTGDFELAVQHNGKTKRAILEVKPHKEALTPNIIQRMHGVASYYNTDLLLLYADSTNSWHYIDRHSARLIDCIAPLPGTKPLNKLSKPISLTAEKHAGRYYNRKLNPLGWLADLVIGIIQGPKPKRRKRKTTKRRIK